MRAPTRLWFPALLLVCACSGGEHGALTARIIFGGGANAASKAQSLRTAAVPSFIDRLQVSAFDSNDQLLAETNLFAAPPTSDDLKLIHEGGTWTLSQVPVGEDRSVVVNAYLGDRQDPRLSFAVAYSGRRERISVLAGSVVDLGELVLEPEGLRIAEIDGTPPDPPSPLVLTPVDEGEALEAAFRRPEATDVGGYLIAVATASSAQGALPSLQRTRLYAIGEDIGSGIRVDSIVDPGLDSGVDSGVDPEEFVRIEGLRDEVPYKVLVYAFDTDLDGAPINYSSPASAISIPRDRIRPSAPWQMTLTATAGDLARLEFLAPGEDGDSGIPFQYEIKASNTVIDPAEEEAFANLPSILAPPVSTPGTLVSHRFRISELGIENVPPFYVGVRAVDAAGNAGPITVAYSETSTSAPTIFEISPPHPIAGSGFIVRGEHFGRIQGQLLVTQTATDTVDSPHNTRLRVLRWSDREIAAELPLSAMSGALLLIRDDSAQARRQCTVIARLDETFACDGSGSEDCSEPFELLSGPRGSVPVRSTLYKQRASEEDGETYASLERFFGEQSEGVDLVRAQAAKSTAVAGTYSEIHDRFVFLSSEDPSFMNTTFAQSATIADAGRLTPGVNAGGADGVGIVVLNGGATDQVPAMLAFSAGGTIRTSVVQHVLTDRFDGFFAFIPATPAAYRDVTLRRNNSGRVIMAARRVLASEADRLILWDNPAGQDPAAFEPRPATELLRVGAGFEILAVPVIHEGANETGGSGDSGGSEEERFLLAYDAPSGGSDPEQGSAVRLLWLDEYGTTHGTAPLGVGENDQVWRLEDIGLIERGDRVFVALLASRGTEISALTYTEIPVEELTSDAADGAWPGTVLDFAPGTTRGRLGCKPLAQQQCLIAWLGPDVQAAFMRR